MKIKCIFIGKTRFETKAQDTSEMAMGYHKSLTMSDTSALIGSGIYI